MGVKVKGTAFPLVGFRVTPVMPTVAESTEILVNVISGLDVKVNVRLAD